MPKELRHEECLVSTIDIGGHPADMVYRDERRGVQREKRTKTIRKGHFLETSSKKSPLFLGDEETCRNRMRTRKGILSRGSRGQTTKPAPLQLVTIAAPCGNR